MYIHNSIDNSTIPQITFYPTIIIGNILRNNIKTYKTINIINLKNILKYNTNRYDRKNGVSGYTVLFRCVCLALGKDV